MMDDSSIIPSDVMDAVLSESDDPLWLAFVYGWTYSVNNPGDEMILMSGDPNDLVSHLIDGHDEFLEDVESDHIEKDSI